MTYVLKYIFLLTKFYILMNVKVRLRQKIMNDNHVYLRTMFYILNHRYFEHVYRSTVVYDLISVRKTIIKRLHHLKRHIHKANLTLELSRVSQQLWLKVSGTCFFFFLLVNVLVIVLTEKNIYRTLIFEIAFFSSFLYLLWPTDPALAT